MITAKYIGDAVVSVIIGINGYGDPMTRDMLLTRVLIAPGLGHNLYSSRFGWEVDGIKTILNTLNGDDEYCMILPDGTSVELDRSTSSHCLIHTCNVATGIDKDELMHNRFGHVGAKRIKAAFKLSGYAHKHNPKDCESCNLNVRAGKKNKTSTTGMVYTYFGECITSNTVGPFESFLVHGYKYAVCFYNHATCYPIVYFLRGKDAESVLRALKMYVHARLQG